MKEGRLKGREMKDGRKDEKVDEKVGIEGN
jgi:hypothetical protein